MQDWDECEHLLTITLNDRTPEVVARAVLLVDLLHNAGCCSELPDFYTNPQKRFQELVEGMSFPGMKDSWNVGLAWHVHFSPTLCTAMHKQLRTRLRELAAYESCPGPMQCTPGSWAKLREVFAGWAELEMTVEHEYEQAEGSLAQTNRTPNDPLLQKHSAAAEAKWPVRMLATCGNTYCAAGAFPMLVIYMRPVSERHMPGTQRNPACSVCGRMCAKAGKERHAQCI